MARLASLRAAVKRLSVYHGVGMWVAATSALLLASFYLDRFLAPPYAMRLAIAPLVWGGVGIGFYWWVIRRVRVPLSDRDAALLVERTYPELKDRLISALQLSKDSGGASDALTDLAIRDGENAARNLDFHRALQPRAARLWLFCGILAAAVTLGVASVQVSDSLVFLQRLLGVRAEFPQRTHLDIEILARSTNVRMSRSGNRIDVKLARGSDLPVRVIAQGEAPDLVELHTSEGQVVPLARTPPNEYFGRFHGVKSPFQFHAIGGDDRDDQPSVFVETVTPPSLSKIHVQVTPPSYSAQQAFEKDGGSFESLVGSQATIRIETNTAVQRAVLRYRGSDEELPFQSSEPAGDAAATPSTRFFVQIAVEKNVRYSIELEDREGLRNPDPGSYSIIALADRPPEVKLQVPSRTELDISPGGLVAIQTRSTDDFGVRGVSLKYKINNSAEFMEIVLPRIPFDPAAANRLLDPTAPAPPALKDGESARAVVSRTRLDLGSLRTARTEKDDASGPATAELRPLQERDTIEFFVEAIDGRNPKPGTGETFHVRAAVMSPADILKRITERLSRAKESVQSILDIQNDRRRRIADLIEGFDRAGVSSVLLGQNRITIDGKSLARDFFESVESASGNRLDRIGEAAFDALERFRAETPAALEDPYAPEVARSLIHAIRSGALGSPELLGELGEMLAEAVAVASQHSPAAAKALDAAMLSTNASTSIASLETARAHQDAVVQSLERLLGMLSKWANFQDVITLTKEILEQQKGLRSKTKESAQPPGSTVK